MFIKIADSDITSSWAHYTWTKIYNWPDKEETLVVVPLHGFADWGIGLGMDVEETIGSAVLKDSIQKADLGEKILVTPPVRFQPQPFSNASFSLDFETAYDLVDSVLDSIKLTGFKKVILFNTGPYNEQFTDIMGRDMRIKHGLQMFCVNLSGLGLDLHPYRQASAMGMGSANSGPVKTPDREKARALAVYLLDEPAVESADPIPNDAYEPGIPKFCDPLKGGLIPAEAAETAPAILEESGAHLARLLHEIAERAPLPNDGAITFKTDYIPPAS
ncbi:creatininase family protein [Pelagicoccus albus]|uniref:Creatininase family protein n=1 Tax=Pelagicoccus albus TaxID=415222 RepID=A0A7X1EA24_9BACT|nr:creatininase family protein [Pelagicoccus albus]MBC2607926.1 creatininase family protein [Pelagicoccus albus]